MAARPRNSRSHICACQAVSSLFAPYSLSRTHGDAATKGSAGWEQTQLPASTNMNATVPLRVWVGRSANKWVARWRRRWRLRRGKLQDISLGHFARQGWASGQFCGPIFGTLERDRNRGRKKWGHTFWVPDSRLCFGAPNPSLIKV